MLESHHIFGSLFTVKQGGSNYSDVKFAVRSLKVGERGGGSNIIKFCVTYFIEGG